MLRFLIGKKFGGVANAQQIAKKRAEAKSKHQAEGGCHLVGYFHQIDDPYSYSIAQVLGKFVARYDLKIIPHIIRASDGRNQPQLEKLSIWERRDYGLIAPHYGLSFSEAAGIVPDADLQQAVNCALASLGADDFVQQVKGISTNLWSGNFIAARQTTSA